VCTVLSPVPFRNHLPREGSNDSDKRGSCTWSAGGFLKKKNIIILITHKAICYVASFYNAGAVTRDLGIGSRSRAFQEIFFDDKFYSIDFSTLPKNVSRGE
jgi:hypothetical protein